MVYKKDPTKNRACYTLEDPEKMGGIGTVNWQDCLILLHILTNCVS